MTLQQIPHSGALALRLMEMFRQMPTFRLDDLHINYDQPSVHAAIPRLSDVASARFHAKQEQREAQEKWAMYHRRWPRWAIRGMNAEGATIARRVRRQRAQRLARKITRQKGRRG